MFVDAKKEQLKVPAKIEFLGELRDFVTKVGHRHGFSERVINAFKLSIDEAATNIIKHAYRDWEGSITIRAIVKKNSLTIVLIDQGKYFDPRQVSDPDLQRYVDIGKKGGLGIFIMRRLLDEIDYRKTEEGNELWMVKYRDVARKRRIAVPAISMTLKARYWLISTAVFTFFLIGIYSIYYFRRADTIVQDYLSRGRNAISVLVSDVATNMQNNLAEDLRNSLAEGTNIPEDIEVLSQTQRAIVFLQMSEARDILYNAYIVDNNHVILASTDSTQILERFITPESLTEIQKDVFVFETDEGVKVVDIVFPVSDERNRVLCKAHFFIHYGEISRAITRARFSDLKMMGLIWLLGASGLFLLIYLVMNPFRRLSEWVKQLGQPGVADEMDIDTSTEIGEIARAFSDITLKLRESQANLAEQERLQKEMQVAQEIQQTLLPSEFPEIEGYEIDSYYAAAKEVGGDYYDFVEVDKDTLGIVVADVSGKGVPGSLVMTMIRTALRTEARGIKDAAEVLSRVNDFVVNDMKKGMFVTLFYVIIDSKRRRLNYASAGHNPMILYRATTNKTYYLNPHGFPIGISLPDKNLFRNTIESDTLSMAEGDILLLYTDGITEAMNRKRQLFGEERFLNAIREYGKLPVKEFVKKLQEEILSFTEGNPQNDDITLVAIKEKSSAEKIELDRAKQVYLALQKGKTIKEACEEAGLSTYAYYSKYKELFERSKIEDIEVLSETESIEAKHLSIEEKTKLYDVIMRYPEYGAKKISEELNSERYGFLEVNPSKIYEELVRAHLNTRELREAFVNRGGKKRRPKPPGTPLLTLDGRVIIQRSGLEQVITTEEETKRVKPPRIKPIITRSEIESEKREQPVASEEMPSVAPSVDQTEFQGRDVLSIEMQELLETPLPELLDKRITEPKPNSEIVAQKERERAVEEKAVIDGEEKEPSIFYEVEELFDERKSDIGEKEATAQPNRIVSEVDDYVRETVDVSADSNMDIDIPEDRRLREKTSQEELDFAAIIAAGEGLEDPAKEKELQELFPMPKEELMETTADTESLALEMEFQGPFEEFLEIEDEQGLISETGDIDEEITEQILQNEIQERLKSVPIDERSAWQEPAWDVVQINRETKLREHQKEQNEQLVSFDELIELLRRESPITKQTIETSASDRSSIIPKVKTASSSTIASTKHIIKELQNYLKTKQFDKVIAIASSSLQRYSHDAEIRLLLAEAYFRTRKYREAAREFEQCLATNPEDTIIHEKLGIIYASQGDFLKAIKQWEKLLTIAPDRNDIRESIRRAKNFIGKR